MERGRGAEVGGRNPSGGCSDAGKLSGVGLANAQAVRPPALHMRRQGESQKKGLTAIRGARSPLPREYRAARRGAHPGPGGRPGAPPPRVWGQCAPTVWARLNFFCDFFQSFS